MELEGSEKWRPWAIGDDNPKNMARALVSALGMPDGAPEIDWFDIPLKGGDKPVPFLLPHKFFKALYESNRKHFVKAIRGPKGAPAQFWRSMRDSPFLLNRPELGATDYPWTIPLGMHGDGGAFNKQDQLYVISWNSLFAEGPTLSQRFLLTVVREREMTSETLDAVFEVMSWSLNVLMRGQETRNRWDLPLRDVGRPLCGGWKGALCQVRGDWAFSVKVFHFPNWNTAGRMCYLCRASSVDPDLPWTDCRQCAGWRGTVFSDETWRAYMYANGFAIPCLLLLVIGLRLECGTVDPLHAVDQGFASHILGDVLWYSAVMKRCFGGITQDAAVSILGTKIKEWYEEVKCESKIQGDLTVKCIRATAATFPKLLAKAAQTRHLARYVLKLVREQADDPDWDQTILCVVKLLVRFYELLQENSQFLSDGAKAEMAEIGQSLAEQYSILAKWSFDWGSKLFKMSPKLHMWEHLTEFQVAVLMNPRFF